MGALKMRGGVKALRKAFAKGVAPAAFTPGAWAEMRAAHEAGHAGYGRTSVWTFDPHAPAGREWVRVCSAPVLVSSVPAVAAAPLVLARGCTRCAEPLDKRAKGEVCSACCKELKAKGQEAKGQEAPLNERETFRAEMRATLEQAAQQIPAVEPLAAVELQQLAPVLELRGERTQLACMGCLWPELPHGCGRKGAA